MGGWVSEGGRECASEWLKQNQQGKLRIIPFPIGPFSLKRTRSKANQGQRARASRPSAALKGGLPSAQRAAVQWGWCLTSSPSGRMIYSAQPAVSTSVGPAATMRACGADMGPAPGRVCE